MKTRQDFETERHQEGAGFWDQVLILPKTDVFGTKALDVEVPTPKAPIGRCR